MNKKKIALFFLTYPELKRDFVDIHLSYLAAICKSAGYVVKSFVTDKDKLDLAELYTFSPDFAGFSLCYNNLAASSALMDVLREHASHTKIFSFGHYFTLYSNEIMNLYKEIDFGFVGEPEGAAINYFDKHQATAPIDTIPGVLYRKDGKLSSTGEAQLIKDLDILPFMDRDTLPTQAKTAMISSSRGCISNCSFCRRKQMYKGWRGRSAKNIVDEIEQIISEKGIKNFIFDDNSFEDPDEKLIRLKSICNEIISRKIKITYNIYFRGDIIRKIDDTVADLLKHSGLLTVEIGIEAGNAEDLQVYNKLQTIDDNIKVLDWIFSHGFHVIPSFINFNPYSSTHRLRANLTFLRKYSHCYRFFTFLDILSYTYLFQKVKKDGLILAKEASIGTYSYNYGQLDNSVYQYKFLDPNVQPLADYLKNFMILLDQNYNHLFRNLIFYLERHLYQIRLLQKNLENESAQQALGAHDALLTVIYNEIDTALFHWLEQLLILAESGWREEKACKITQDSTIIDQLDLYVKSLFKNRNRIFMQLNRLGVGAQMDNLLD